MFRRVRMHDTARADIEDDEDVQDPEGRSDRDEEITRQHLARGFRTKALQVYGRDSRCDGRGRRM